MRAKSYLIAPLVGAALAFSISAPAAARNIGVNVGGAKAGAFIGGRSGVGVGVGASVGGRNGVNAGAGANIGGSSGVGAGVGVGIGGILTGGTGGGTGGTAGGGPSAGLPGGTYPTPMAPYLTRKRGTSVCSGHAQEEKNDQKPDLHKLSTVEPAPILVTVPASVNIVRNYLLSYIRGQLQRLCRGPCRSCCTSRWLDQFKGRVAQICALNAVENSASGIAESASSLYHTVTRGAPKESTIVMSPQVQLGRELSTLLHLLRETALKLVAIGYADLHLRTGDFRAV